ncbi:MAG TPA: ABC transporter permease, partial [Thermoanaerobaculia bacterium]|nr:ABC transporter permease [Thermoanaerobaculia bacterium]
MTPRDALLTSLGNLAAHKLRSGLAMLGVVFGVGTVIAMLSIGAGAEREAMAMIERLGVDNILVRARRYEREQLEEIRRSSVGISQRDIRALEQAVPGVAAIAPKIAVDAWAIRSPHGKADASVFGVTPRHAELSDLRVREGRFLDALDVREHAQVCAIGPEVEKRLFGWRRALGGEIKVNDIWLTVVGILEGTGGEVDSFQGVSLASSDDAIYVPLSTAQRKFDRSPLESPLTELVVRVPDPSGTGQASLVAARSIRRLLANLHGGAEDYELVVPQALLEQSRATQRLFNLVMGSMAGISLLVGGIGIMNIMLASVMERTREIGVRRALGARKVHIRMQFVTESFTISVLGGVAGILLGVVLSSGIAIWAGWPTAVSPLAIVASTLVAMVVGVASGLWPAIQASELDP